MIEGVSTATNATPNVETQGKSTLGKDDFLKLMIAQLQNQDPLEPMDGSQYSAQLAQFSSLEQMKNINDTLNLSLDANYLLAQSVNNSMTAALVGKEVKVASDTITYQGQEQAQIGFELLSDTGSLEVNIYNENGVLVKKFDNLEKGAGQYKLNWDFTDNTGGNLSVGKYTVEIKAKNNNLKDMEVPQYIVGKISGVRFSNDGASVIVNGIEYQVSDVAEVVDTDVLAQTGDDSSSENDNDEQNNGS
ncbi:MAG: flagellar hook capping protein [Ignavibacteriae bacterium]|nr:MAG: flagellar hook capping protein [Ignavibacteriota bacterium]